MASPARRPLTGAIVKELAREAAAIKAQSRHEPAARGAVVDEPQGPLNQVAAAAHDDVLAPVPDEAVEEQPPSPKQA